SRHTVRTMNRLDILQNNLLAHFGANLTLERALDELTLDVPAGQWVDTCTALRDQPALDFSICIDLCGVDYLTWGQPAPVAPQRRFEQRYAVVVHLLSITHNWRLRVRTWVPSGASPVMPMLAHVWPRVNRLSREAFDLYGLVSAGHPVLRRTLPVYGLIGQPFRKVFPLSGHVQMRYDPEQKRVIFHPVTIE